MSIVGAIIVPHPPLILPRIGRGQEKEIQATIDAYRTVAGRVARWQPETVVIASPHVIMYSDYFHISPGRNAKGDMSSFGAPQVTLQAEYDTALRAEIIRLAEAEGLFAGTLGERSPALDHGVFIPLYFLREAGVDCPIVRMGLSGFSPLEHYNLGVCVAEAAKSLNRRTVFIASGDLSHKLKEDVPYGFVPEGPLFDRQVTDAMASGDFLSFLTFDPNLPEKAAECGLRSFQIMAGALDGVNVVPKLYSYEGPFGVGYAVAEFAIAGYAAGGNDGDEANVDGYRADESDGGDTDAAGINADKAAGERSLAVKYRELMRERLTARKAAENPWASLARLSLETYIRTGKQLKTLPEGLPSEMLEQSGGVFVSLHRFGQLRGCIGTISPVTSCVAREIIRNAVSAGTEDPRFHAVNLDELDDLEYKVDVLGSPEPATAEELDVRQYGVIVSCGSRRGLLLPDLEGVDTVQQQIEIACRKGGISPGDPYTLERFQVVRHT